MDKQPHIRFSVKYIIDIIKYCSIFFPVSWGFGRDKNKGLYSSWSSEYEIYIPVSSASSLQT